MTAVDAVKLMLDGCACPCGADGLHPLWTDDDGVGEAILELEGWGDWWVGPGGDYPFAPGGATLRPWGEVEITVAIPASADRRPLRAVYSSAAHEHLRIQVVA